MADLTLRQLALCALGLVLIVALGFSQLRRGGEPDRASPGAATIAVKEHGGGRLVIHVAGAVRRPGVYKLAPAARVADAVERAGGARRRADLAGLNLAAQLEDGRQVLVPERMTTDGVAAAGTAAPAPGQPLNINSATLEQLDTLTGVGPLTAQKILEFRDERGGFGSVEELGEIPGIGDVRLATLREEVTL